MEAPFIYYLVNMKISMQITYVVAALCGTTDALQLGAPQLTRPLLGAAAARSDLLDLDRLQVPDVVADKVESLSEMPIYKRARVLAKLSAFSYRENVAAVKEQAKELGFDEVEKYDNNNAEGYRFENPKDIVISLRGTEHDDPGDIRSDLQIRRVPHLKNLNDPNKGSYGLVHRGFLQEAQDLWPKIKDDLRPDSKEGKEVYFTGHSLGAAMATIMAHQALHDGDVMNPIELHTFGSPRAGNKEWVDNLIIDHHRWQNNNDIVPRMPPNFLNRYKHHGTCHYMDANGMDCGDNLNCVAITGDRLRGYRLAFCDGEWKPDFIADHGIKKYVENMDQMIKAGWDEEKAAREARKANLKSNAAMALAIVLLGLMAKVFIPL